MVIQQHDAGEVEQHGMVTPVYQSLGEGLHQHLHAIVTEIGTHADHYAVGHIGDAKIVVELHGHGRILEGGTDPFERYFEGISQGCRGADVTDRHPQLHHGAGNGGRDSRDDGLTAHELGRLGDLDQLVGDAGIHGSDTGNIQHEDPGPGFGDLGERLVHHVGGAH